MSDQPRTIQWEFKNEKAIPKLIKKNKIAAITDGAFVTKITLFEEFSSKVLEGKFYVMKGYTLRGESPPYHILVTKNTQFYRSSRFVCKEGIMEEARELLCPTSPQIPVANVKGTKGLLTVEGKIVQVCLLCLS